MYYLFGGYDFRDVLGGVDDLIGTFSTLVDATAYARQPQRYDWWHVAELRDGKLVIVARND